MNYLLDTHILIWLVENDIQLSSTNKLLIENPDNSKYVSKMSLLEIVIKQNIKKLDVYKTPRQLELLLIQNNISIIDIEIKHLSAYLDLPLLHRDPFDRILIAQAIAEDLIIITHDNIFKQYDVKCIV